MSSENLNLTTDVEETTNVEENTNTQPVEKTTTQIEDVFKGADTSRATEQKIETETPAIVSGRGAESPSPFDKPLSSKTQQVFDVYNAFQKDIGPYVTFDEAKSIIDSNYDNDAYLKVIKDVEARKAEDLQSFTNEGRDYNLIQDGLSNIRTKVAEGGLEDLSKSLNAENFSTNFNLIKNFVDDDDIFRMGGINPELPGANKKTRSIMSFALYDDATIATQAKDAIIASLPEDVQEKYNSLNYKGKKIHVQNYQFDDGQKRLIFKIPEELGGDNKYQLFNKPGLTFEDFAGFTGELVPLISEITAGIASAKTGPAGVAFNTAIAGGAAEMLRLYIGKNLGVNQDLTENQIIEQGVKRALVTGISTRIAFPVFDKVNKLIKNVAAKFIPSSTGTLSNKIIKDVIYNYRNGLNKDKDTDTFIKELKDQLTRPEDEGGAGLDPAEVDKFVKKTFANNNPGTAIAELEKSIKVSPQGLGTKRVGDMVGAEGEAAAVKLEKESIDAINDSVQKILGIRFKKVGPGVTERDLFDIPILEAKQLARNNKIRLTNVSEKLNTEWKNLSDNVYNRIKTNPEEYNFNSILMNFMTDLNTGNYQLGNVLRGKINDYHKNTFIKIPKSSVKITSPSKIFNDAANVLKGRRKFLKGKDDSFSVKLRSEYDDAINTLNFLKGQFQTGKQIRYIDAINAKGLMEDIAQTNPKLAEPLRNALFTLNTAINTSAPNSAKLAAQHSQFISDRAILRGKVLGNITKSLGGTTRGSVAEAKAVSEDFFPMLFGNKPEQIAATRYLGNIIKGNTNQLDQKMISDFKLTILDRFIKETSGPNAISPAKFKEKYFQSLKNVFDTEDLMDFRNLVAAKNKVNKIQTKYLTLNANAQKTLKLLPDADVSDITPVMISEKLFDPKTTPKMINQFFSSINKNQGDEIKGYFMKQLFDDTKSFSGILGKDTVDGGKLFKWFSDGRNQQVFENLFGAKQTKNMKVLSAALEFMQRPEKYIKAGMMSKAEQDAVRQTATRMIYGPLSHENVLIKGALFFLNKLDTKLGKELFDYDFFVEKFKNSYAFKYAPQLNDEAFQKYFNTYDAGLTQRIYTGTTAAIGGSGTEQTIRGTLEEETGLPTLPVLETIASAPFVGGQQTVKAFRGSLNDILSAIDSSDSTKRTIREYKKFQEKEDSE